MGDWLPLLAIHRDDIITIAVNQYANDCGRDIVALDKSDNWGMVTRYAGSDVSSFNGIMALFNRLWLDFSLLSLQLVAKANYSLPDLNPCLCQPDNSHVPRMGTRR